MDTNGRNPLESDVIEGAALVVVLGAPLMALPQGVK
jgi:hypothetical protein